MLIMKWSKCGKLLMKKYVWKSGKNFLLIEGTVLNMHGSPLRKHKNPDRFRKILISGKEILVCSILRWKNMLLSGIGKTQYRSTKKTLLHSIKYLNRWKMIQIFTFTSGFIPILKVRITHKCRI